MKTITKIITITLLTLNSIAQTAIHPISLQPIYTEDNTIRFTTLHHITNFLFSTNDLDLLLKNGTVCNLRGHNWVEGRCGENENGSTFLDYHPGIYFRHCHTCGKLQSQTSEWKDVNTTYSDMVQKVPTNIVSTVTNGYSSYKNTNEMRFVMTNMAITATNGIHSETIKPKDFNNLILPLCCFNFGAFLGLCLSLFVNPKKPLP